MLKPSRNLPVTSRCGVKAHHLEYTQFQEVKSRETNPRQCATIQNCAASVNFESHRESIRHVDCSWGRMSGLAPAEQARSVRVCISMTPSQALEKSTLATSDDT